MDHDQNYYTLRVAAVVEETADTRSFVLEIPAALRGDFAYRAGQFCTFRAGIGGDSGGALLLDVELPDVGDPYTTTVKRCPKA